MSDDRVIQILMELQQGQRELLLGQTALQQGQTALQQGQAALEQRVLHLETAIKQLAQEAADHRVAVMAKFERLDDKIEALSKGLDLTVDHVGGILDQLTSRESQLGLLQDAIRAGINAESIQVRTMQKTLQGMQSIVLRLQSQFAILTERLDELEQQSRRGRA